MRFAPQEFRVQGFPATSGHFYFSFSTTWLPLRDGQKSGTCVQLLDQGRWNATFLKDHVRAVSCPYVSPDTHQKHGSPCPSSATDKSQAYIRQP
jgi:hypothetical protein